MSRSTRSKKQEEKAEEVKVKTSWMDMLSGGGFGEIASIAQAIADRLTKAEEFLERCEKQSKEAVELATKAANEKSTNTKLNTTINQMQDTLEDLKSRVRDLEKENTSLRSKVKEMRERVDTRTERSDTDTCRKQRAEEKAEEDGNQLVRRVMQWKENNVKRLRCERMLEELSEVSSCMPEPLKQHLCLRQSSAKYAASFASTRPCEAA